MLALVLMFVESIGGKIAELKWLSEESLEMRVNLETELPFGPGMFVNLKYNGTTRSFTACNHKPDDMLELFIRMKPGGEISGKLQNAKVGEPVEVVGPLPEVKFDSKKLLCIAGGSGMAAFVALARAVEEGLEKELVLFISARRLAEVGFREELESLKKSRLIITLTREEREGYETGRIDRASVEKYAKPADYKIFICGPEAFTLAIGEALQEFRPHLMRW